MGHLLLSGWPPRLLINAGWWRTASYTERYSALNVLAGQREDWSPDAVRIYGQQPRDLPPERTPRAIMAAQSPAWWQAVLAYQVPMLT